MSAASRLAAAVAIVSLFVGVKHDQTRREPRHRDFCGRAPRIDFRCAIQIFVEHRTQEIQALCDPVTNDGARLADAARESDDVDATHDDCVSAHVLAHAMCIQRDRQPAAFIAAAARASISRMSCVPSSPFRPDSELSRRSKALRSYPPFAHQVQQDSRIDIAAARSHHQALERRHAHAGLDAATILDRCHARAVAEVAGDYAQILRNGTQAGRNAAHHVAVARCRESHSAGYRTASRGQVRSRIRARAWEASRETPYRTRHVGHRPEPLTG